MNRLLLSFVRNSVLANLVLALLLAAAFFAVQRMVRESWPEFRLDLAVVSVPYPGADPEEVEEGVCRKIEEALEGVEGIRRIRTTASEGAGVAILELFERADSAKTLDAVRNRIDAVSTFPPDAEKPVIEDFELKEPVLMLAAGGDLGPAELKNWANDLKDDLLRLPDVRKVEVIGDLPFEISVDVSEERLRSLGISFDDVSRALRAGNLNHPCGDVRTDGQEFRLRLLERKYSAADVARIPVRAFPDGRVLSLGQIADVRDSIADVPLLCEINGKPGVYLVVGKTPDQDALRVASAVQNWMLDARRSLPPGADVHLVYDLTEELRQRIQLLVRNAASGLLLVFALLWLFLDARVALWVGVGMVSGIGAGIVLLWISGGTINMVSLFALVMVLGILVDDGIVLGEAIHVRLSRGVPGLRAAVDAVAEMGLPVVAAVATTVVAFVPLLFIGGIMGKFIRILPVVVISCLCASLVECLFILPAHLARGRATSANPANPRSWRRRLASIPAAASATLPRFVDRFYLPSLRRVLDCPGIALCSLFAVIFLVGGLLAGGFVQFEMFPEADGFVLSSTVEFPDGTPLAVSEEAVRRIEAALDRALAPHSSADGSPIERGRQTLVGAAFGDTLSDSGPHVGSVQVVLVDSSLRSIPSRQLLLDWEREIGPIPGAVNLSFEGMEDGPSGAALEIEIKGADFAVLADAADRLQSALRSYDGVCQIRSDLVPGKEEIRFRLKPEAPALGIQAADLAAHLSAGFFGDDALTLQRGRDEVKVVVRYPPSERRSLDGLRRILVRSSSGAAVPLSAVAHAEIVPGYSSIKRVDGLRRIVVSAEVDPARANAQAISAELERSVFPAIARDFPGARADFSGDSRETAESFDSLKVGFPLAVLGIYAVVAAMFRSYLQPLVILFTVPFGLVGAVLGHLLLGFKLSLMSMFGMVALAGVVVNDAIVLIEAFNDNLARRMPFLDALCDACRSRFRAIFLTTVTTVGGLAPLILERSYQAQSLIPMAISIAAGLVFATLLTLYAIPCLLLVLNRARLAVHFFRHRALPAPEAVEPAIHRHAEIPA